MWIVVLGCFSGAVCRRWCHKTERQRAVGSLQRRKYKKVTVAESAGDSKEEDADVAAATAAAAAVENLCAPESQYDQESCVICLSEFENGDSITTLPCGHDYHTECIKPWLLKRSSKCPICKASFLPKKNKPPSPSLESTVATPLLSDQHAPLPQVDADEESAAADSDGQSDEDAESTGFEEEEGDEDERHWPNRVFGLSPGALVLTAACTTGIGIAVAIVIFLLDSSLP